MDLYSKKTHTEKIVLCTEIYRILHKTFRAEVRRKKNRIPCCFCHRMFVYSLQLSHSLLFCTSIKFLWSRSFEIETWQVFINFSIAVQHFQCFFGVSFQFAGPRGEFVVWWNNFYWEIVNNSFLNVYVFQIGKSLWSMDLTDLWLLNANQSDNDSSNMRPPNV